MKHRDYMSAEDLRLLDDLLRGPWERVWPRVRDVWGRADAVYVGLTFPLAQVRARLEFSVAAELLRTFPDRRADLARSLLDPNPVIAAYALVALECGALAEESELPPALFDRKETITVHRGCLRGEFALPEFARGFLDRTDPEEEWAEAEVRWAGRERACPWCGTRFASVQDLGACPACKRTFRASEYPPT